MATGTFYIVPLERLEIKSTIRRHPAKEWLCTDEYNGKPCLLVDGQPVSCLYIYAEGEHALDFYSRQKIGRVIHSANGILLALGKIRAPLVVHTDAIQYTCEATPATVKQGLEPLRPYGQRISEELRKRCADITALVEEENARDAILTRAQSDARERKEANLIEIPVAEEKAAAPEKKQPADSEKRKKKSGKKARKGQKRKKKKNKKVRIILIVILCILVLLFAGWRVLKTFNSKCGSGTSWRYAAESNLLIVSGKGDCWDYPMSPLKLKAPWVRGGYGDKMAHLILDEGITSVGDRMFSGTALEEVTIPYSVTEIGEEAFKGCSKLSYVTIPTGVKSIGKDAFSIQSDDPEHYLFIYYGGTTEEWIALLGDTQIDSTGAYIAVKCSDQWTVQADGYGRYTYLGDDQWEEYK